MAQSNKRGKGKSAKSPHRRHSPAVTKANKARRAKQRFKFELRRLLWNINRKAKHKAEVSL